MTHPLLSYYGDDFTGSTDVMEALASNGIETVLFLGIPSAEMHARFSHCRAIGIAGTSRSEPPEWMDAELTPVLAWLKALDAGVCHYKVCSTFDSSPRIGNIGRAIEIGKTLFAARFVPVLVGAPQLKRYTAFGHLFAGYQGQVYRIDRHPVMSRHPVTPMAEADLTIHLSRQTDLPVSLADLATLAAPDATARVEALARACEGILFIDADGPESQRAAGRALLQLCRSGAPFVAGSSGVEYAMLQGWREEGLIGEPVPFAPPGPVERMAVVSGSVSPTTERQIRQAQADGFETIAVDPLELIGEIRETAMDAAVARGLDALARGVSPLLYTALGPGADQGREIDRVAGARNRLGQALGQMLLRLIEAEGLTRAVIAGGDTSSHALQQLKIEALTTLLPLPQTPGSPLCTAHGSHPATNGLQVALKGGQVGGDGYFAQIRAGRAD